MNQEIFDLEKEEIQQKIKKAANWFYWIAGLSIINSILSFDTPSNIGFIAGLGICQVVDEVIIEMFGTYNHYATIINLIISLVIAFIGYQARKASKTAFIIGLNLYALDAILFFYFNLWLSFAFHISFLYFIYQGIPAINELKELEDGRSLNVQETQADNEIQQN